MNPNATQMTALLIDDDPVLLGLLSFRLQRICPRLAVTQSTEPQAPPGYDVYVIDNDFGGAHSGARLAERIRMASPDALILVFSSFLDVPLLKRVVNVGADGVFDKREEADIERLLDVVATHVETNAGKAQEPSPPKGLVGEIVGMLQVWNAKLAREENARVA
jgi:DNA-binding NarL/FixJ family response regulator